MPPSLSLGTWWTTHLQLPGYDPIATAGPYRFDMRAAEQALAFCTQALQHPLSPWEAAIVLNLWGWRQANGQRRYITVYAEPYRHDALAVWCASLALWLLRSAPPRRPPQVNLAYAQAGLAADVYTQVTASLAAEMAWSDGLQLDPARQTVETARGGVLSLTSSVALYTGEVLLNREGGQPLTLAVATRDAEQSAPVALIAAAAQQALAGERVPVLPALL